MQSLEFNTSIKAKNPDLINQCSYKVNTPLTSRETGILSLLHQQKAIANMYTSNGWGLNFKKTFQ